MELTRIRTRKRVSILIITISNIKKKKRHWIRYPSSLSDNNNNSKFILIRKTRKVERVRKSRRKKKHIVHSQSKIFTLLRRFLHGFSFFMTFLRRNFTENLSIPFQKSVHYSLRGNRSRENSHELETIFISNDLNARSNKRCLFISRKTVTFNSTFPG